MPNDGSELGLQLQLSCAIKVALQIAADLDVRLEKAEDGGGGQTSSSTVRFRPEPARSEGGFENAARFRCSTRRPSQLAAGQQVQVEMRHFLSAVVLAVDDDAVAAVETKLLRNCPYHSEEMAD